MVKKYTLEEIMGAWSKYKTPLYYHNGYEKTKKEYNSLFSNEKIRTDASTSLKIYDRYKLGVSFPEFMMELQGEK